jgi:hypothetical protein
MNAVSDNRQNRDQPAVSVVSMTTTTTTFRLLPIPSDVLEPARVDEDAVRVVAIGGEPVRCCRRDAMAGEALLLTAFAPPLPGPPSPYQETGAIFTHETACAGPVDDRYPADWFGRPQVLRAYDERGWIHPATRVHDGTEPEKALTAVLAEPGVVEVHSRNVAYGCWMFTAVRD